MRHNGRPQWNQPARAIVRSILIIKPTTNQPKQQSTQQDSKTTRQTEDKQFLLAREKIARRCPPRCISVPTLDAPHAVVGAHLDHVGASGGNATWPKAFRT